ncbi:hypothetical protein RA19_07755 [Leisingera sp. ANG-M1]|uniref:hypothetical protein n=1 Tax=Leisingera sp. ANG-M1 TaxID=1577895 RepID=UPI00057E7EB6|nr:hypothetical protein [Leisingera sp. ANG-M1]KIC11234.1 hypothetical protein RA19_07755 [Leisingera sp. ANG-M1]
MHIRSFDERIDGINWQPSVVPTRQMIDSVLGSRLPRKPRSAVLSLAGAVSGIAVGVGLKGMTLAGSPWGPGTGLTGALAGTLALTGLALSVAAAGYAAARGQEAPRLMQFASMNLLMIVVLLLS